MGKYDVIENTGDLTTVGKDIFLKQAIANELAELVEAKKDGNKQLKEANRLKRLELSFSHNKIDMMTDKDLEDQA